MSRLSELLDDYPQLEIASLGSGPLADEALTVLHEIHRLRQLREMTHKRIEALTEQIQTLKDEKALDDELVEAALRFTFRNTLRPQSDADEKLAAIQRVAFKIQQARFPGKKWDTGI